MPFGWFNLIADQTPTSLVFATMYLLLHRIAGDLASETQVPKQQQPSNAILLQSLIIVVFAQSPVGIC
jgi:hypothetical protein